MAAGKNEILDAVRKTLTAGQIERSLIYWYKKTLPAGDTAVSGQGSYAMPFDGTMVFVDLAPRANWAHPCLYLFIESGTLATKVVETSLPPAIDQADENFVVIQRFGEPVPDRRAFDGRDTP